MSDQSPRSEQPKKQWVNRLERAAGELNVILVVVAIGLATLDFTCLFAFKVRDALPSVTRVEAARTTIVKPAGAAAMPGPGQAMAAAAPTKPAVSATGW